MGERPCGQAVRQGRLEKAQQFITAAELLGDLDTPDVFVSLCVLAGIAAADTICCARLGVHWQGDDHTGAVELLRRASAPDHPTRLATLLSMKSKAGYTSVRTSRTDVKKAGRAARELVQAAEQA